MIITNNQITNNSNLDVEYLFFFYVRTNYTYASK